MMGAFGFAVSLAPLMDRTSLLYSSLEAHYMATMIDQDGVSDAEIE